MIVYRWVFRFCQALEQEFSVAIFIKEDILTILTFKEILQGRIVKYFKKKEDAAELSFRGFLKT